MRFISIRQMRQNSAKVWRELKEDEEIILTTWRELKKRRDNVGRQRAIGSQSSD